MSDHAHNPADKGAALTGFFAGAIGILIISFIIVMITNRQFAGKEGAEKPSAETSK